MRRTKTVILLALAAQMLFVGCRAPTEQGPAEPPATPAQAEEAHAFVRGLLQEQFGAGVADALRIQYGGSVKPDNAAELFEGPNVDGFLVGGASLDPGSFAAIVKAAH